MRGFLRELRWDLRGNRTNAALSYIALLVAMLSFVLVSVLGQVGTDALVAQSEQTDGRAVTLQASLPTAGWSRARVDTIATALHRWPAAGYQGSLVLDRTATTPSQSGKTTPVTLRLTSTDFRSIRRVPVIQGRWFDVRSYPGEAAVNPAAAALLTGGDHGKIVVDLGFTPALQLTVVGTVADANPQPVIYASDVGVEQSALLKAPSQATLLVHTSTGLTPAATSAITSVLRQVGIQETPNVSRTDQAEQIKNSLSVLRTVFLVVALISLFVAVVGMINVGLASVRERLRDFTIRRAMGATRTRVVAIVAAGTVVVGLAASVTAVALSYLASALIVPHLIDPTTGIAVPTYPWWVAAQAGAVGLLASLLSGLAPALRTRSLDLAALLRE